jgi:mono/diheme cytochrome c family protein
MLRKIPFVIALSACGGPIDPVVERAAVTAVDHGRDLWLHATFGGEKFFSLILPNRPFNLPLGFDAVLTSNRDTRFRDWGVINDPDCVAGDASTGGLDRCSDPTSSGVVGIRRNGGLFGVACAGCHAGLDPAHPPADPNHPAWSNIHLTVGNQYLDTSKIFRAHLSPHDPRWQVFNSWAPGTVDTTAIENDGINNPGIITQFFDFPARPFFGVTQGTVAMSAHRAGQGGEDDFGCESAALRVYFNIGMCAAECMIPHLGPPQTPIDLSECEPRCPDLVQAEASVGDLCQFMFSTTPPSLASAPGGSAFIDERVVVRGAQVFAAACASCHGGPVLSDDLVHPASQIGTNPCRSKTTNWTAGHIWAEFSSDQYKARGPGFYRDVPLQALWATAPFLHNNRLGPFSGDPSVAGRIAAYEAAIDLLLDPWKRSLSIDRTTDFVLLPAFPFFLPAGTPVVAFNQGLCNDPVENEGHYFGALLPPADKYALKEFLKTQ